MTQRRLAVRFSLPSCSILWFWQVDLPRFWGVQLAACFCVHPWRPRLPSTTVCVTHAAGKHPGSKIEFHEEVFWKRVLSLLFGPQIGDSANSALPRMRHSAVFHQFISFKLLQIRTRIQDIITREGSWCFEVCERGHSMFLLGSSISRFINVMDCVLITESGCSLRPSSAMSFETERRTTFCPGPCFPLVACFWRLPLSRKRTT